MESKDGRNKKNWGEKWKVNKPGQPSIESQMIETSNFMVHPDYLNKYGTLSNGVLTKSIKYAETWLYGTVGVRGAPPHRPSLFLYPGVVGPPPGMVGRGGYPASPPGFVGVPALGYPSSERGGYVLPRRHPDPRFVEHPPPQCGDCGKDVRSGTLCKKCGEKRTGSCRSVANKNRVSADDAVRTRGRKIAPSPDPYNLMRKSRLGEGDSVRVPIFPPALSQKKVRTASASPSRRKSREPPDFTFETFKPKQPDTEKWRNREEEDWTNGEEEVVRRKSILECDVNAYELNKSRSESKDDEDSAGELEVGFSGDSKLKISRPKLNKTDFRKEAGEKSDERKECWGKSEVRLNGQRFKIFDNSSPSAIVEGYVSDDEQPRREESPSPKRPPRRPKAKASGETGLRYSKSKSKSSPNLSIKSILKKPPADDEPGPAEPRDEEPPREPPPRHPGPGPRKQTQNTLKKKKQVQFRVNGSRESLNQARPSEEAEDPGGPEGPRDPAGIQRSRSCDNLPFVALVELESEVYGANAEPEELERSSPSPAEERSPSEGSLLKRSFSDRRPSSALVLHKDDFSLPASPPGENLFNDTMALRRRPVRLNAKEMFVDEKKNVKKTQKLKNSDPEKNCLKLSGNIITYAEFSELIDSPKKKENSERNSGKETIKIKPHAPDPPPRQPAVKASSKPKSSGTTSVRISTETEKDTVDSLKDEVKVYDSGKVQVRSFPEAEEKTENCRIVVELGSSVQERSPNERRTSVTIFGKNESENHPRRKTSVIINAFDPGDDNKVRISVRNEPTEREANSSTCTIIETGSNSTVIPVVSTDNKTTLIVGSNPSPATFVAEESLSPPPREEVSKQSAPSPYIFSTVEADEKSVEFMDPVEAVRRNLVPHICGKEDGGLTLMEKIKQSRETKEQQNLKQISRLFENITDAETPCVAQPSQFLLSSYKNKKQRPGLPNPKPDEDSSAATSRSNSFCSTAKNSSGNTSRSSSFRSYGDYDADRISPLSKFYVLSDAEETQAQEKDKLECEYEIRNGFQDEKRDVENIYETIREEPIYDKIGPKASEDETEGEEDDVPPPLPLTSPPSLDEVQKRSAKSIFEGASKYDILNYLVDAKERVKEESYFSGEDVEVRPPSSSEGSERASVDGEAPRRIPPSPAGASTNRCEAPCGENDSGVELGSRICHASQTSYSSDDNVGTVALPEREALKLARKSSAEIERNDSGVGSETSHTSRSKWQSSSSIREDPHHLCEDCDQAVETQITDSGVMYAPLVCRRCSKRRSERKEIIQEIVETEEKYGRDLKIILEEFYTPMLVAGLLAPEQLAAIFLNTEELLENSEQLTEKLRDALEIAVEQGDEDLLTVNVGKHFLEAGPMLHAFESYCTRQGAAAVLLANLEKEKELLRIFLRVSQMENAVLRRMNLNSFLMVPVQRVTKYPLLLARLYKVTPPQQEGRELLKEARHNIELHLEHMNSEAKDVSAPKVWRRFSTSTASGRKSTAELEMINIKLRKMAVDVLDWNHEEVRFVMEGKLLYTQPTDSNWKRGRTIKLTPIFVLLATLGKPNSKYKTDPPEDELAFPAKTGIREATLLLVKEKCGRYTLIREPLYLDKIIVCCETDVDEYFEVQELSTKDSFIFKAEDGERTKEWYRHLQYHAQILGAWRRRRNALANIMINGMMARAYSS